MQQPRVRPTPALHHAFDFEALPAETLHRRVKFALNTESGEKVAIKILDKEKIARQGMGEQIKKEIAVMKMVQQSHVVNLLEVL